MNWKKTFALLLLFVLTIQTFGSVLMIAGYYVNRDYIARNLCVNKTRPELNCCGRCHLSKQLKEDQKENDSKTESKFQYKTEVLSSKSFFSQLPVSRSKQSFRYNQLKDEKIVDMPRSIFQPPDLPVFE